MENGEIAALNCFLNGSSNAHSFGASHFNQRIENWWSHFRRSYSNWVINFFKTLVSNRILQLGHHFYMECTWFVFSTLLQNDLNKVRDEWNSHKIRKSRFSKVSGIPNQMYYLPESYNSTDQGRFISELEIDSILRERNYNEKVNAIGICDPDLERYFQYILDSTNLHHPARNWKEALENFTTITNFES